MARHVTGEASPEEDERLKTLYAQQIGLKAEIDSFRDDHVQQTSSTVTDFDADAAFNRLHQRIQDENLL